MLVSRIELHGDVNLKGGYLHGEHCGKRVICNEKKIDLQPEKGIVIINDGWNNRQIFNLNNFYAYVYENPLKTPKKGGNVEKITLVRWYKENGRIFETDDIFNENYNWIDGIKLYAPNKLEIRMNKDAITGFKNPIVVINLKNYIHYYYKLKNNRGVLK